MRSPVQLMLTALLGLTLLQAEAVKLQLAPAMRGSQAVVLGTTDLPDGAKIMYELKHEIFDRDVKSTTFTDGQVAVSSGKFSITADVGSWPAGRISIWAGFQLEGVMQPPVCVSRFGARGEKLTGLNVKKAGYGQRVEVTASLTKR